MTLLHDVDCWKKCIHIYVFNFDICVQEGHGCFSSARHCQAYDTKGVKETTRTAE